MNCALCERVELTHKGEYPYLVHEFANSYLMLGEHQYYPGYCVLVLKEHHKEMTDLSPEKARIVFDEMMLAHQAIEKTFAPTKMNLCSLGNVVPHIHWHFFPRYASDPDFKSPPWLQMHLFDSAKVTPEQAREAIEKLRAAVKILSSSVR